METKKIIGIVIISASVGLLVFLYKGYLKPRMEFDSDVKSGKISTKPTLTTNK